MEQQINADEANLGELFGRGVDYSAKMDAKQMEIIKE